MIARRGGATLPVAPTAPVRSAVTTLAAMGSTGLLPIGEVSARTGLSIDTVRFYEQQGLMINPVRRDAGGRRLYGDDEVGWLGICRRLRASGMALPDIQEYARLVREGTGTEPDRFEILRRHEQSVRMQIDTLRDALGVIEEKVRIYQSAMEEGTADQMFIHDEIDDRVLGAHRDRMRETAPHD